MIRADVLICGVGGQGVLLASEILARAALAAGLDVKKSEVHGMAQRGGSVESHVRLGPSIASPLVPLRKADVLLGFEPMEALRYARYVKPEGTTVYSIHAVVPPSLRDDQYPHDIDERLRRACTQVVPVEALETATKLGNLRVVNVVLLGVLAHFVRLHPQAWQAGLTACLPARLLPVNQRAFDSGLALMAGHGSL